MGNAVVLGRTKSMVSVFAGVAAMNTAMVGATTAGALIVAQRNGPSWSGLPATASVLGTAAGALGAGVLMARRGGRFTLSTAYGLAVAGGIIAFAGAVLSVLVVLLAGIVLLGIGNAGAQLSRYVAADLYPEQRRGFAVSTIVWGGTVGALAGPALIAPASGLAVRLGLPSLSGPVAVSALTAIVAMAAILTLPREIPRTPEARPAPMSFPIRAALRRPVVLRPLVAMIAAQLAMVAVMTMTPLQLQAHGHGLGVVGWVLSAHMIGMFALAPLSGRIADRWGGQVAINCGLGTLAVAAATAVGAPTAHTSGLPLALFLLGYGWNLVFVGGSSLLSRDLPVEERARLQGMVDALVWGASALASLAAGLLFADGGYVLVAVVGGVLALLPFTLLTTRRERI
ncbi:MFS transporter [Amycolatopsis sp. H20-H5]|uniref:MFS transporter n=1 Tax=Amycolatopsis sp. H20-H5 TaxID=3046309 RepID=UPI002DBC8AEA|nr:MFS transporter [Amycolatopsis sp. H20-H5]MEC3979172.1 MFS transporter [Amycolatopsis sp. H20-H5]